MYDTDGKKSLVRERKIWIDGFPPPKSFFNSIDMRRKQNWFFDCRLSEKASEEKISSRRVCRKREKSWFDKRQKLTKDVLKKRDTLIKIFQFSAHFPARDFHLHLKSSPKAYEQNVQSHYQAHPDLYWIDSISFKI